MRIRTNYVLIKPDENYSKLESGLIVVDAVNPHYHVSATGTVVVPPEALVYMGREIHTSDHFHAMGVQRIRDINDWSMPHDTQLEIKVGDRVMFNWVNHLERDTDFGDNILMKYEDLFCRVDESGIYPLNGRIIVEQLKKDIMFGQFKVGEKRSDTEGVVRFAGCVNSHYLTLPRQPIESDDPSIQVGTKVLFEPNGLTRVEYQLYKEHTDYELWAGFRKDILGIFK
jgi:hypothetical protein